jgi:hypothetical protein
MSRLLALLLLSGCLVLSGGCAMCCAPFDYDYQSVAGRWVRTNPSSGRVGSVYDNAGGPVESIPVTTTAVTPDQSMPAQPTPAQPPGAAPRSIVPRNLGDTYLPRGQ